MTAEPKTGVIRTVKELRESLAPLPDHAVVKVGVYDGEILRDIESFVVDEPVQFDVYAGTSTPLGPRIVFFVEQRLPLKKNAARLLAELALLSSED